MTETAYENLDGYSVIRVGQDGKIPSSLLPTDGTIILRHGTDAEVDAATLEANEPVVGTDTGKLVIGKTGGGVHTFYPDNDLTKVIPVDLTSASVNATLGCTHLITAGAGVYSVVMPIPDVTNVGRQIRVVSTVSTFFAVSSPDNSYIQFGLQGDPNSPRGGCMITAMATDNAVYSLTFQCLSGLWYVVAANGQFAYII
jgi:hypothetical protein